MEKSWGYWKNEMEYQRQEAKVQNLRTPENSWLQATLIDKRSSKSFHAYTETKHHPRANKFQSKTYHRNSQQCRNIALSICPKSGQTHRHLKTHYWTVPCTQERRNTAPPTRTSFPNQEILTSQLSNHTHRQEPPQWRRTTNYQNMERPPQTKKSKQNEKAQKY